MRLSKPGEAGTQEKNDVIISIQPMDQGTGVQIDLTSPVIAQYGQRIRTVIDEVVRQYQVSDAVVRAEDRGALDFTIRARTEAAIIRALR